MRADAGFTAVEMRDVPDDPLDSVYWRIAQRPEPPQDIPVLESEGIAATPGQV
ncbi:hypothetical protein [Jiangella alkaliphila]|uniref:Uncharacterized protein n=1 Tax=Jiangella alkaliphila TaxID=419479 RepID=A0A1H2L734_9ACTN|nr:hypothetical protein [Jiangella alkaliphila]SDU76803.1 hypothetical protein SAMN04488563_5321 [Jiangella alkaliphila]